MLLLLSVSNVFAQSTDWSGILEKNNVYKQEVNARNFPFLDSIARDKRIIMLGEKRHDHGASRTTIAKIIRYLHEKHEFNAWVMENDMVRLRNVREGLKTDPLSFLTFMDDYFSDVFNFNDVRLYEYVYDHRNDERPLRVYGGDVAILFGKPLQEKFIVEYEKILPLELLSEEQKEDLDCLKSDMFLIDGDRSIAEQYLALFDRFSEEVAALDSHYYHRVQYVLLRNHVYYEMSLHMTKRNPLFWEKYPEGSMDWGKTRDSLMALTFEWLLTYGPLKDEKKIVVSYSAWHIADNLSSIGAEIDEIDEAIPMKELLSPKYKDEIYSIAFVNYGGYRGDQQPIGYPYGPRKILPEKEFLREKGIEGELARRGYQEAFVDFTKVKKNPLFYMSPTFRDKEYYYDWTKVYSGIYFIKEMEPIFNDWVRFMRNDHQNYQRRYEAWKLEKKVKYFE